MTTVEPVAAERLYLTDPDVDVVTRHVARYQRAIRMAERQRMQRGNKGGRWLDAACGTGYGTFLMTMVADVVDGVDADPDAIAYARQHYRAPHLSFACGDIAHPAQEPWLYDVVVSVETMEHLAERDQLRWVRRVASCLNTSGVFVMTCPIGNGANPLNPHHLHEPTEAELLRLLRGAFANIDLQSEPVTMTTGEEQEQVYACCWNPR